MASELCRCRRYHSVLVFSNKDKILIRNLYQLKECKAMELTNEFPNR